MLLLAALAHADDLPLPTEPVVLPGGRGTAVLPTARQLEAGGVDLMMGGAPLSVLGTGVYPSGQLDVSWSPSSRVAIGLLGGGTYIEGSMGSVSALYLKTSFQTGAKTWVGPWVAAGAIEGGVYVEPGAILGFSVSHVGPRFSFDGSFPVYGVIAPVLTDGMPGVGFVVLGLSELAFSVALGQGQSFDFGLTSVMPHIGWTARLGRFHLGVHLHSVVQVSVLRIEVGGHFGP